MVNWFGFASMAETASDSRVRGRVDIAELPHEEPASSASLNVYWVLAIGRGSPYAQAAYNFLRHCLTPPMDKLLTLGGAIGCRLSTWNDSQVNEAIPFHHRLRDLHTHARELPRRADWPSLASLIDDLVLRTINSGQPVREVAQEVQRKADALATAAGAHGVL
jgi:multiple sugar transport system substrate-binding protein